MQNAKFTSGNSFPVFLPLSKITVIWQFFVILFILVDFVITVMVQCFESYYQVHLILYNYFDKVLIPIMFLDILMTFNTCHIKNGIVRYERRQIAIKYVSSLNFWVDLACFIVSIIQVAINEESNYNTAYNFIVFIKVIKMYSFDKNIKRYALKSSNSLLLYEIVKNIIFLSLICYALGAFFYLIDYNLYTSNKYAIGGANNPNPQPYWILFSDAYANIIDQNLWVKVTYCYYFTIVLLSGVAYGDLVPLNPLETLYVTLLLFFPLVVYSYIFNAIYNIISKKRERNKLIRKYQFISTRYLKNLRVKKTLQTKLITYLTFIFKKTAHNTQFVDQMGPSIRKEYLTSNIRAKFDFVVFQQMLEVAPLTNKPNFEDYLIQMIKQEAFPQRYKLIMPPERFKLYYINQGICKRVATKFKGKQRYSDSFFRGQYFGYHPFLTGTCSSRMSYESANFVVVQSIDRTSFLQLLNKSQFYDLKQAFFMMREEKLMYQNQTIDGQFCFFCNSSAHILDRCHHLRPQVNYSKAREKSLSREHFVKYGAQNVRYFDRKDIKSKKVILSECPVMIKEELPAFSSVHVQCSEQSLESKGFAKRYTTGKIDFFSVYYPQHNFLSGWTNHSRYSIRLMQI